ncbi:phage tail assembly chaperone [Aminobacter aminovorans]|uniref:phage tail assembly chaperone n=1 Tax=Aminobacter aminovorans TaxID=83263 RepID=UPI003CCAD7A7
MPAVDPDTVNPDFEYLLEWFWDISAGRSHGFSGPNPLSMTEIANWSTLTGTVVRREELSILRAMDGAFMSAIAKEQAEVTERQKSGA